MRLKKRFIVFPVLLLIAFLILKACSEKHDFAHKATETEPLKIGQTIPKHLKFTTATNETLDLTHVLKESPVILIYYRGGWCPYCNLQLRKIRAIEKQLTDLGYKILAVSPDLPENGVKTAEKLDINFTLLSDSKLESAKKLGIAFKLDDITVGKYKYHGIDIKAASGQDHNALPVPSVFIIDKQGLIQFAFSNPDYKIRIENADLLKAAKASILNK